MPRKKMSEYEREYKKRLKGYKGLSRESAFSKLRRRYLGNIGSLKRVVAIKTRIFK